MSALTSKADWDKAYRNTKPYAVSKKDQIANWLLKSVPRTERGRGLEIGCYPGRFLPLLGSQGYELNGIDIHEGVRGLKDWLSGQGFACGDFVQQDFFTYTPERAFDLVISLGFVEHFENWQEVLRKHAELVAPGGVLVIEAPNFLGRFQHWFHRTFDATNLSLHHLPAMDPEQWAKVVADCGLTVSYSGYFGRFHVWTAQDDLSWFKRKALKYILRSRNLLKHLLPQGARSYSPYAGLVARRAR